MRSFFFLWIRRTISFLFMFSLTVTSSSMLFISRMTSTSFFSSKLILFFLGFLDHFQTLLENRCDTSHIAFFAIYTIDVSTFFGEKDGIDIVFETYTKWKSILFFVFVVQDVTMSNFSKLCREHSFDLRFYDDLVFFAASFYVIIANVMQDIRLGIDIVRYRDRRLFVQSLVLWSVTRLAAWVWAVTSIVFVSSVGTGTRFAAMISLSWHLDFLII